MQIVVFLSIVSYVRLEIDTKSVTNCQTSMTFGIDMVFFAPAFEHYSTDGERVKKELWHVKEVVSKQAHLN